MGRRLTLSLLLLAGIVRGLIATPPLIFEDWEAQHYNLEIQVDITHRSVAGTMRAQVRAIAASRQLAFLLSSRLQLVHVKSKGASLSTRRQGDTVLVQWPNTLKSGTKVELEILYGGSPPYASTVWGKKRASLDPGLIPSHHWWPCLVGRSDSMTLHVITPREVPVWTPGRSRGLRLRPGQFIRRSFAYPYPITPDQIRLYVGNLNRTTRTYHHAGNDYQIIYLAPTSDTELADQQLTHLTEFLHVLEEQFGEYPFWPEPLYWVAPQSETLQPTSALDTAMIEQLAGHWFGRSIRPEDELAVTMLTALRQYARLICVEQLYDRETANRYLFEQAGISWGNGLFYTLRQQVGNDARWWKALKDLHNAFAGTSVSGLALYQYFTTQFGKQWQPIFDQYLLYRRPPRFQYRVIKERRNAQLFYRWQAEVKGLPLTMRVRVGKETQMITPTDEWQKILYKGVSPKEVLPIARQGYFEVERLSDTP